MLETFVPSLSGAGGMIEQPLFSGSITASGNDQAARNWLGSTGLVVYKVTRAARLVTVAFQLKPAGVFPANSDVTVKIRKNGVVIATMPVMTGDGTAAQVGQEYMVPQSNADADLVAGDEVGIAIDATNVPAQRYWTSATLTLVYP